MRMLIPVCAGLVVISGIVSTIFWRDLRAEREVSAELRVQLEEARIALAAKPAMVPVVEAASPLPAAAPAELPARNAAAAVTANVVAIAKKQKTLLDDPEYRRARLAQARIDLRQHYAGLVVELGLSEKEADELFDRLAEQMLLVEQKMANTLAGGAPTDDAAVMAEMTRFGEAQKEALVALLGPQRFEQLEQYEQTQPSRTRVNNLTTLLARQGRPLTNAQTRSLTAAIVAEQKRMEAESKVFTDAGQTNPQSAAERQVETNRRILQNAAAFLDAQQLEVVRGRFQQRASIDGAADAVQRREREVLQQAPQ